MGWSAIGHQLRHPNGWGGRLVGHAMAWLNDRPNRLAIDALAIRPGHHVLELGCGPGAAVARIAPLARVTAIDQSQTMLAQALRRNRRAVRAGRVVLHHGSFDRLPLADETVDRVLAVNVAYFWTDPARVLGEAGRVLKTGGRIAVYVTDAATMSGWPFAAADTHRLYDSRSLTDILIAGGFTPDGLTRMRVAPGIIGLIATAAKSAPAAVAPTPAPAPDRTASVSSRPFPRPVPLEV
jgi:SAM-dependent methyltransferase